MKKLMKMTRAAQAAIMLAFAASVTGALAWDVSVPATNDTVKTVMAVPPVVDASELTQLPVRATSVVVVAGAKYRIGSQVIVAAHAGTMTNSTVTTTAYYTNGIPVALAAAQYAATNGIPVYTNIYTVVAPISVPAVGMSGYDGTVRWYRARTADQNDIQIQLTYGAGTVKLTDSSGSVFSYTAALADPQPLYDYKGALYVSMTGIGTNTVSPRAW